ncbi:hypothetical protein LJC59_01365 [Desulfovibrio sp. OttesenSCG-928-A18]|nr:hypothetical protein [Desulfovibrio sp. OttesenSCG-928-A18]
MKKLLLSALNKTKGFLEQVEARLQTDDLPAEPIEPKASPEIEPAKEEQASLPGVSAPEPSTFEDRKPMNNLLGKWAKVTGRTKRDLRPQLRAYAGVKTIDLMTKGQVRDACIWIQNNIQAAAKAKK